MKWPQTRLYASASGRWAASRTRATAPSVSGLTRSTHRPRASRNRATAFDARPGRGDQPTTAQVLIARIARTVSSVWVNLVTWNVNSLKARLPRVLEFLGERSPDL